MTWWWRDRHEDDTKGLVVVVVVTATATHARTRNAFRAGTLRACTKEMTEDPNMRGVFIHMHELKGNMHALKRAPEPMRTTTPRGGTGDRTGACTYV